MKSSFFYGHHNQVVAEKIRERLNSAPEFLSDQTMSSTRATGDAIQDLVAGGLETLLGEWCKEYSSDFARRAMADIAFTDREQFYCIVDVKTHRMGTNFNMPNLTSVERLSRLYEDDHNVFAMIMVRYAVEGHRVQVADVLFEPIEFLDWQCLTIGALGWGQIQIANSNHIVVNHGCSRKEWMLSLCDVMLEFYPKEILKIEERAERFMKARELWVDKEDVWA